MTMLVYHDSVVHDWWEGHNYNRTPSKFFPEKTPFLRNVGSGDPELKAVADALWGCPPNLFTFGKQYSWADIEARKTFSYLIRLEDEEVQRAIRAALPVAALHKKIGKLEMTSFGFLSEDFAVQTTTFSDGTRIVGNVSREDRDDGEYGMIPACSWLEVGRE